jgi:hypothetical protein
MKKYDGYEQAQAFTGDFETLAAGGYVCKILKVTSEDKDYGTLLRIGFDIAEGEHKDFYKRSFERKKLTNPDAKWGGMYYQTVKEDDLKYFKGFITAIEGSNSGFNWDWDEKKLVGKLFGGLFGEEEYEGTDGEVRKSVKCKQVRTADKIRTGDFTVPECKKLCGSSNNSFYPINEEAEDPSELPF